MNYTIKPEDAYLFESLKNMDIKCPPIWNPFVLYGKDNPGYGIGCPSERFMRDDAFKSKMSEIIKETYKNGRVHARIGVTCPDNVKQASAEANSKQYKVTHKDGSIEIIKNLNQWCRDNNHRDPAVHKAIKEQRTYKGLSLIHI